MEREKVEDRLGKPYQIYTIQKGLLAVYEYNRGYIPPAEKDPKGKLAAPLFLFTELVTLGGLTYIMTEVEYCQIGQLRIVYDTPGKILAAKECPGKTEGEGCGEMQSSRRPSTLPAHFKDEASVNIDCNLPRVNYTE